MDDNCRQLLANDRLLQEQQHTFHGQLQQNNTQLQAKDRQLQHNQHVIASRDQALERKERELQQTQQLVSEFKESLQQKDKTITELQRTISEHKRKTQQLEQGATASRDTPPQQEPVETRQTTVAAAQKDISKMRWREGNNAPERMTRGAAVVHGNTVYFSPSVSFTSASQRVYSYQNIHGKEQWSRLPDNPNRWFGLAVIDGLLTIVGGSGPTNTLLSLTGEGERKQWSQIFPPMPTSRLNAACVTAEQAVVVAGGIGAGGYLDTVEVMNTDTKVWTKVASLPEKCRSLTATVLGDRLYLAGGSTGYPSKSVFTCSLPDLLPPDTLGSRLQRQTLSPSQNVWKRVSSLPVIESTLVSFGGHLLAVGGAIDGDKPTSNVYRYDSHADSWTVASQMKKKRYYCLAAALGEDGLVVVGGWSPKLLRSDIQKTNSVELLI